MKKYQICFGPDGTVTAEETLPLIARHFHVEEEIEDLTRETLQENIPFVESFIRRVFILGRLLFDEVTAFLETMVLHSLFLHSLGAFRKLCCGNRHSGMAVADVVGQA